MLLPYPTMTYHYIFSDFNEKWTAGYLNVPVLISFDFGKRYFATIGAKAGLNLFGQYKSSSDVSLYASDSEFIDDLTDMPNHYLADYSFNGNGNLNFNMNVTATAEFGVNLDEWLAVKPRKLRRGQRPRPKTFKESLHYRASVFVDYGLMNINNYTENKSADGKVPVFISDESPLIRNLNSVLSTTEFSNHNIAPIYAGIKFAVLYEIPKKKAKPQRPVRTARPVVVQRKTETTPTVITPKFIGIIVDSDTKTPIAANIELFNKEDNSSVYKGISNETTGTFKTDLAPGTYLSHVTTTGYLPYDEEIIFVKDTIFIPLQKAKQGVKVVLKNVFFAFNKTKILPESDQALEDLYNFLVENPEIKIKITGHTDNVGSVDSNQKLSNERAKSVRNYIVEKGIAADRISYEGKGETEPCDTNDTEEGRAANRRVEFTIL